MVGKNATPSLLGLILVIFRCDRSAVLDGRVIANRRTVFRVSILSGRFSDLPQAPNESVLFEHPRYWNNVAREV